MQHAHKQRGIERWVQGGLILIVALMPFHAFLSVWLGSLTHHQAIIQAWKEVVLLILGALTVVLLTFSPEARDRLRTWPVLFTGLFGVFALIVTALTRPSFTAVAFGAKTDLEFLVAFVIAVVATNLTFSRRLVWAVLVPAFAVAGFGLLQSAVLAPNFLTHFGYGPGTVAPYEVLDPAVKSLRFGATLGGPNQLGTYLILPLTLAAIIAVRRRLWWLFALPLLGIVPLIHTYSRGAWLGAGVTVIAAILVLAKPRLRVGIVAGIAVVGVIGGYIISKLVKTSSKLQYYILHGSSLWDPYRGSDFQHLTSLRTGLQDTFAKPLGHGLGTAGPATFHSGQGIVIESNYLQMSYETGLAGLLLFIAILISLAFELGRRAAKLDLAAACFATLIGISVTALVLPAWTDSSTALIFWIAAGTVVGLAPETRHV